MNMEFLINASGVIGLVLLLSAFFLEEVGKTGKHHVYYNILNAIGSLLLVMYAWYFKAWIFVVLNTVWIGIAGYYLCRCKD